MGAVRRTEPDRRDRLIDVALDVVAEVGVAGASHRKIAARADVPLGSMTYHFDGMDELLHEAFTRFADSVAEQTLRRMTDARTPDEAREAVVDVVLHDIFGSRRELVITHELYTLAARRPEYRSITHSWMARSRAALEQHFDPLTARMIDALTEGLTIHRALDDQPADDAVVREAVRRIIG